MTHISEATNAVKSSLQKIFQIHQKWVNERREEICAKYGELDDDAILDIIFALRSQSDCEICRKEHRQICINSREKVSIIDANGKVTEVPCQKMLDIKFNEALERANVPKIYRHLNLKDDYKRDDYNLQAVNDAKNLIKNRQSAFIQGTCGTGKTMLAAILAQEAIRAGFYVKFTSLSKIIREIRAAPPSETQIIINNYAAVDYLVIDDLGTEAATAQVEEVIFDIINEKYNNNSHVIITTNLEPNTDLTKISRQRIFSRLKGTCKEIILSGPDKRLG